MSGYWLRQSTNSWRSVSVKCGVIIILKIGGHQILSTCLKFQTKA
nr:MAG TPA: hypothetical protein [Caudoviricetes sp.]